MQLDVEKDKEYLLLYCADSVNDREQTNALTPVFADIQKNGPWLIPFIQKKVKICVQNKSGQPAKINKITANLVNKEFQKNLNIENPEVSGAEIQPGKEFEASIGLFVNSNEPVEHVLEFDLNIELTENDTKKTVSKKFAFEVNRPLWVEVIPEDYRAQRDLKIKQGSTGKITVLLENVSPYTLSLCKIVPEIPENWEISPRKYGPERIEGQMNSHRTIMRKLDKKQKGLRLQEFTIKVPDDENKNRQIIFYSEYADNPETRLRQVINVEALKVKFKKLKNIFKPNTKQEKDFDKAMGGNE